MNEVAHVHTMATFGLLVIRFASCPTPLSHMTSFHPPYSMQFKQLCLAALSCLLWVEGIRGERKRGIAVASMIA